MSIADRIEQSKLHLSRIPRDAFVVVIVLLSASLAYGLGVLTVRGLGTADGTGFSIEPAPAGN